MASERSSINRSGRFTSKKAYTEAPAFDPALMAAMSAAPPLISRSPLQVVASGMTPPERISP